MDSATGQELSEIPNSNYGMETPISDELWGDPVGEEVKYLDVMMPVAGNYTLRVFSLAGHSGSYTVRIYQLDPAASSSYQEINGYLSAGGTNEHVVRQVSGYSIPYAKSHLGAQFGLKGVVSSASNSATGMYMQQADRSIGIKVVPDPSDPDLPYLPGDVVDAAGTIELLDGELQISSAHVTRLSVEMPPTPLGLVNRELGGRAYEAQPGVTGASGLNNVGLLVKTWGTVTDLGEGTDWVYMTDESAQEEPGTRIATTGLTKPGLNDFVEVTGISSVGIADDATVSILRPRSQADMRVIQAGGAAGAGGGLQSLTMGNPPFSAFSWTDLLTVSPGATERNPVEGSIGYALARMDGCLVKLHGVHGMGRQGAFLTVKNIIEAPTDKARLLVEVSAALESSFAMDVEGVITTLASGERAVVSASVWVYTDEDGKPVPVVPSVLMPAGEEWPYKKQVQ